MFTYCGRPLIRTSLKERGRTGLRSWSTKNEEQPSACAYPRIVSNSYTVDLANGQRSRKGRLTAQTTLVC